MITQQDLTSDTVRSHFSCLISFEDFQTLKIFKSQQKLTVWKLTLNGNRSICTYYPGLYNL